MKVVIFFMLTAFLEIASSDLICMEFKLSSCFAMSHHAGNSICSTNKELTDCLRVSALECGVESQPIIGEVLTSYTEVCTEGTEMNDLYKKHEKCVFRDAAIGNLGCMAHIMTEVFRLGTPSHTREYQERVLKVICKYGDSGNKCIDDNINATCGAEAARFRRQLSDPSVRLSNLACEEADAETNKIHYAAQQHHDHSVHAMSPHTQHLPAVGSQAGSIQIASTMAPMENFIAQSAATINVSSHLIYILLSAIVMKWLSPY